MSRKAIILIGCGKAKQSLPGWTGPAAELYTGSLFQARKRFAKYCLHDSVSYYGWYIVSAKYGLMERGKIVRAYDFRITDHQPNERKLWALDIASDLLGKKATTGSYLDPKKTTIAIHMGADYAQHLVPVLQAVGYGVIWPVKGMSQGEQLAWYADVLKAGGVKLKS
jgi:hypothetical protein